MHNHNLIRKNYKSSRRHDFAVLTIYSFKNKSLTFNKDTAVEMWIIIVDFMSNGSALENDVPILETFSFGSKHWVYVYLLYKMTFYSTQRVVFIDLLFKLVSPGLEIRPCQIKKSTR